ncbi:MAG: SH3 domain-containing protein [Clostridia bacterium]|nr:SH3 domain-containing protein [Clostridia bacterium]
MKRLLILLTILLGLCCVAHAEQQAEEAALQAMLDAYSGYTILSCDQWGNTAAAALGKGEKRILCVAEKNKDAWELVIYNPAALPDGVTPSIHMDTDTALFWSYEDDYHHYSYTSVKEKDVWRAPSCIQSDLLREDAMLHDEREHHWEDGLLSYTLYRRDQNENLHSIHHYGPFPAAWLTVYSSLASYDDSVYPTAAKVTDTSWLNQDALLLSAAEIAPEYTFVDGAATDDGLELLMQGEDGSLRMITWAVVNGTPITNISAALPEGTRYGSKHVWLPTQTLAWLGLYADGVWHVKDVCPDTAWGSPVHMGRNWISDFTTFGDKRYVGDHPWSSLSMDWSTLPTTLDEALESLDASRWAVVNNPDPADRLHLRERANKNSASTGKYYNGTPAEVLQKGDVWTRVRVAGWTGWMMTKYLAFGEDGWAVENAFPQLNFVEGASTFPVWKPESIHADKKISSTGDWTVETGEDFCIIGTLDEEWYHIWFTDLDVGGYMRQSDFWPGNG